MTTVPVIQIIGRVVTEEYSHRFSGASPEDGGSVAAHVFHGVSHR